MRNIPVIALAGLLAVPGCGQKPIAAVNPEAAKTYATVSFQYLNATSADPDAAIRAIQEQQKKIPGNAMDSYLLALAYEMKHDWESAANALKEGNRASSCVHYVEGGPMSVVPGYARLRQFVRDCAAAAPGLGVEKGAALLQDARRMAKKVAGAEPRGLIPVLVGAALRAIADRALVSLYEKAGRAEDTKKAQALQAADKQWSDRIRAEFKETMDKTDLETLIRKHFTEAEWAATKQGTVVTPETKAKFDAMQKEMDTFERPLAEKALKDMPD